MKRVEGGRPMEALMAGWFHLLRCFGKAVVGNAARALAQLVPFGEVVFDVARDTGGEYLRDQRGADLPPPAPPGDDTPPSPVQLARGDVADVLLGGDPPHVLKAARGSAGNAPLDNERRALGRLLA